MIFILGGIVLILMAFTLKILSGTESGKKHGNILMLEKLGDHFYAHSLRWFRVINDGVMASHAEQGDSGKLQYTGTEVLFLAEGENSFYDGKIITVTEWNAAMQFGSFPCKIADGDFNRYLH